MYQPKLKEGSCDCFFVDPHGLIYTETYFNDVLYPSTPLETPIVQEEIKREDIMRAKIAKIRVDVDYQCPNCRLHFRLSGKEIPKKKAILKDCPSCLEHITVPPLVAPKKISSSIKQPNAVDPIIASAINALRSQGYTAREAKDSVSKSYLKDITLATLIKKAILNNELSKTPTV